MGKHGSGDVITPPPYPLYRLRWLREEAAWRGDWGAARFWARAEKLALERSNDVRLLFPGKRSAIYAV